MTKSSDYEIKLEIFEGPMDLLIHLIRKNEVDIFDIPIAFITDQYLAYLDMMKALNITVAGEFLVMASTLMHIKSRMLLPSSEDDEEEDPRDEIARPLLEFLQLKEAAGLLTERPILERDVFARRLPPDYAGQFEDSEPLIQVNLFQLIDAFKRIIEEHVPGAQLAFNVQEWSLKDKTAFILDQIKEKGTLYFRDLFSENCTLSELVVTFLAILELIQSGLLRAIQPDPQRDIRLEGRFNETEDQNHG